MTTMEIVQDFPNHGGGAKTSAETAFVIAALAAGQIARLDCESSKEATLRRTSVSNTLRLHGIPFRTRLIENAVYFAPGEKS